MGHSHYIAGYKYHLGMHLILGYSADSIKQVWVSEKVVWPVPDNPSQESPNWVKPSSYNDPSNQWTNEPLSYDGKTNTGGYDYVQPWNWTSWLELIPSQLIISRRIRFNVTKFSAYGGSKCTVHLYINSNWIEVYNTNSHQNNQWYEVDIGSIQVIEKARIKIENSQGVQPANCYCYEFEFDAQFSTIGTIYVDAPNIFGGEDSEGGIQGSIDVMYGLPTQDRNNYLISKLGATISAYRGLLSVILKQVYLGTGAYIKPWSFLVKRTSRLTTGETQWYSGKAIIGNDDLNPIHIIRECLTNKEWGLGENENNINDENFMNSADILYDEEFGLSLIWDNSTSIEDFVGKILETIAGFLYQNLSTGKWEIYLTRDDYDVNNLEIFDEDDIIDVEEFNRPAYGQIIDQIVVNWLDRIYNKERPVIAQDIALIEKQNGNIIEQICDFPGICNPELAAKIAARELKVNASMLAIFKIKATRRLSHLKPNDVFKLSWDKYNISSMIIRVIEINYGNLHNNEILLNCAEDVFSSAETVYNIPQDTSWESPVSDPINTSYRKLLESPYYILCNYLYSQSIIDALNINAAFMLTNAVKPISDAIDYTLLVRHKSELDFIDFGVDDWCPSGILKSQLNIGALSIEIELENVSDLDRVTINTLALIDNEIVKIISVNSSDNKITIARGVLDTIPVQHSQGSRVWIFNNIRLVDYEYINGDIPSTKFLTRTGRGILAEGDASIETISAFSSRMIKPYLPGNLKIKDYNNNYQYFPEVIGNEGTTQLSLTWRHRNRKDANQLQSVILWDDNTNYGPESGCTYTLKIYDKNNSLIKTETGLTGTSYVFTDDPKEKKLRFELWSVRSGYDSYQIYNIVVRRYSLMNGIISGQSVVSGDLFVSIMIGLVQSQSNLSGNLTGC